MKNICESGREPTETVVRRDAITTAAAILYTRLAAGVLSENGRPQGQVCIEHVVCDGANNVIIFVIKGPEVLVNSKGPEVILNSKGVPTGVGM